MADKSKIKIYLVGGELLTQFIEGGKDFTIAGVALSGETAINEYNTSAPDIIFVHVKLNAMSGFETARMLKEHSSNLKVVLCSQSWDREIYNFVLTSELCGYLTEVSPNQLNASVTAFMTTGINSNNCNSRSLAHS